MSEAPTPRRAFGRQLSDLWLDGKEGKLHPAEWKLLECARVGSECRFGDSKPVAVTGQNTIRGETLRFLALGGDASCPVHEHGITLVGGHIECGSSMLDFSSTVVHSNLAILSCVINGVVDFVDSKTKSLIFTDTTVEELSLWGTDIDGDLYLDGGFEASRPVHLNNGTLSGDLRCNGGKFRDETTAIDMSGCAIAGSVRLEQDTFFTGTVVAAGTAIDGSFLCNGSIFSSKSQSIHAPRSVIGGNVNLGTECRVAGGVSFQGAKIAGDLTFQGGSFETKGAINLRNATIDGMLVWRDVAHLRGELNLSGTACRTLNMDWRSWEKPSQIRLDNFTYLGFSELPEGCNAPFWINWLERQPERHLEKRFRPKPYKQLASVLSDMGHEEEARSVRIAQRRRQADFTRKYDPELNRDKRWIKRALLVFWNFVQRLVVAYGYRPGNALLYLGGLILVGSAIYHTAARDGIMTPTHPLIFKEAPDGFIPERCAENWVYLPEEIAGKCAAAIPSEYSEFNAIVYSLDTAIPVVDFRMESDWAPRVVTTEGKRHWPGWWVRTWEWFQIGAGWALSLLFVSAIGGVIRRE